MFSCQLLLYVICKHLILVFFQKFQTILFFQLLKLYIIYSFRNKFIIMRRAFCSIDLYLSSVINRFSIIDINKLTYILEMIFPFVL